MGQLDIVKDGALITIRNAHANVVREHLRIEIDRWAKVEVTPSGSTKITTVKTDNNLSDIAYELVPVGKWKFISFGNRKILGMNEKFSNFSHYNEIFLC